MAIALYRKYRPQTFAEVIGQQHITDTLVREVALEQIAHAYLFTGPRGLGKTTTARLLAKAINCSKRKKGESEPCNRCDDCIEITAGRSLDVLEIDAASNTGVDNVRDTIITTARFTPSKQRFKVFIIDEVHMLSASAFNALLKTLEEPPAHAIFILATTEIYRVPETIISRCQRFDFRPVAQPTLVSRLAELVKKEKKSVDAEVLEVIARRSGGSVRDAESLLGQILTLSDKKIELKTIALIIPSSQLQAGVECIKYLVNNDTTAALQLINQLVEQGVDIPVFAADLVELLRLLLLATVSEKLLAGSPVGAEIIEHITTLAKKTTQQQAAKMVAIISQAARELKTAEIVQLPLEVAIVELTAETTKPKPPLNPPSSAQPLTKSKKTEQDSSQPLPPAANQVAPKIEKPAEGATLTLEQIKSRWEELLILLKEYNQSLASTLRHHLPTDVKAGNTVEISFKYKFYQQRINDGRNRQKIEDILGEMFSTQVRVATVLVKNLPTQPLQLTDEGIGSILESFGGRVIE